MRRVLIGRRDHVRVHVQRLAQRRGELVGLGVAGARRRLRRDQFGIEPERLQVLAPVKPEGPAGQLLARIPLALSVMDQAAHGREAVAQAANQLVRIDLLGRADGGLVPLRGVAVELGHEGRLAAHGQLHAGGAELFVHQLAGGVDLRPGGVGERVGDARLLAHAADLHVEVELDLRLLMPAGDRRGGAGRGRGRERDMPLGGQQARGGVEPDPAGAGDVDLRPGVQVGEIRLRTRGAVHRLHIRGELDQVARHEARGQAAMAQQMHQQPGRVAAGAGADVQRLLRILHAGFHAHEIVDGVVDGLVDGDEEVDRVLLRLGQGFQDLVEERPLRPGLQVGAEVLLVVGGIVEGDRLGRVLHEEVERVDRGHVGHEVHADLEMVDPLGEHQPGQPVAEGVLLPVEEMRFGRDLLGIGEDLGAAVRRRTQAHDLGAHADGLVVAIGGPMRDRRVDAHLIRPCSSPEIRPLCAAA